MRLILALAMAAAVIAAPAAAATDAAAYAAFVAGDYEGAAQRARLAGGAENYALAARARNAIAYFEDGRKQSRDLAERALEDAEKAVKANPALAEGYVQAAISLGLRGAKMAPARAFLANIPTRVRRNLDAALLIEPDHPAALSTSAAWRMEVARRGGAKAYGAVPEEGFAEFEKARRIHPGNVVVAYECALRLLASGREEWRAPALEALAAATSAPVDNAFDRGVQARAWSLQAAVAKGREAEAAFIAAQP